MPTYGYRCVGCGHEFDLFQSITAKPIRKCPQCGKLEVKRLLGTGSGIIFKGSGFYQTDYRSDNYTKSATSDKGVSDKQDTVKKDDASGSPTSPKTADSSPKTADSKPKSKSLKKSA
jgi:putative FmdB family regulatory protein